MNALEEIPRCVYMSFLLHSLPVLVFYPIPPGAPSISLVHLHGNRKQYVLYDFMFGSFRFRCPESQYTCMDSLPQLQSLPLIQFRP
jgi:hypothetical protein